MGLGNEMRVGGARIAGGPSRAYQESCEEETSHHNITTSSTHYCAYDSVAHNFERPAGNPNRPHDWQHHRSATYPTVDPHPGIRRGDSVLNAGYVGELAKSEKSVRVLGLEDDVPHRPGTVDEEGEEGEVRCRDRILERVKGGLERALAGRAGTGSLDPRFASKSRVERVSEVGGESGERREMRERWRRGLMEEEAKIGRRVGRR